MATKLDDLKFNDYTLKGTAVSGGGTKYTLGTNDSFVDTGNVNIIRRYEGVWTFEGVAANAAKADQATVAGGIGNASGCGSIPSADVLYLTGSAPDEYWYFDGFSAKAYAVDNGENGSVLYYDTNGRWVLNAEAPSVGSSGGSVLYYDGYNWILNATAQYVGSVSGGGGGSVLYYDWNDGRWVLNAEAPSVGSSGGSVLYYDTNGRWVLNAEAPSVGSSNGSALYYDRDDSRWILNGSASYANSAGSISGVLYESGSNSYKLNADTFVIQGTEYSLSVDPDGTVKATLQS